MAAQASLRALSECGCVRADIRVSCVLSVSGRVRVPFSCVVYNFARREECPQLLWGFTLKSAFVVEDDGMFRLASGPKRVVRHFRKFIKRNLKTKETECRRIKRFLRVCI